MRALAAALVVSLISGTVMAQPGAMPPDPQPAPQPPPPPQGPYAQPPPYTAPYGQPPTPYGYPQPYYPGPGYGPPIRLSPEDQDLLASGEITDGQVLGGVLANVFIGFGIGQAIQGRWSERGWIFTLGETGSIALMIAGAVEIAGSHCDTELGGCRSNNTSDSGAGLLVAGLVAYGVFYVWGIVDAAVGPSDHNLRVRELRARVGYRPMGAYGKVMPYVAPHTVDDHTAWTAGVKLRF